MNELSAGGTPFEARLLWVMVARGAQRIVGIMFTATCDDLHNAICTLVCQA